VWCTKYRKPLLVGEIANFVKTLFLKIASDNEFVIQEMEIMPDHVHLFITTTPAHIIVDIVKALKGVSARFLFKEHPEVKQQLWGGHLWNASYYVGTVGHISEDTVKKYIESQSQKAGDS
jgi:putative transposase